MTGPGAGAAPADLLDAFWAYDQALLTNDVAALDRLFAPGDDTLRGDGTVLQRGHSAIAAFRRSRPAPPTRAVTVVHVRSVGDDAALILAEVASAGGSPGLQTQLWQRVDGRWRVAAAHVSAPSTSIDRSVWRVVGAPLVHPAASGILDGFSVAVKDLYGVEGQRIGAGVAEYASESPPQRRSAFAVERLLLAGAAVTGIAQTDQFAYSIGGTNARYGAPLNLRHPDRVPGGSTSGSATAVARGWSTIGLGTDTAGSIRVPAAYQGLWGIRSTHGVVPRRGLLPLAPSFDAVGWLSRDAAALRAVATVLIPERRRTTVRADLVRCPELEDLADTHVLDAVAGHDDATPLDLGIDLDVAFQAFRTLQAHEAWTAHGEWITAHPGVLDPDVAERFAAAAAVTPDDAAAASGIVRRTRAQLRRLLGRRVLLLPTVPTVAPRLDADAEAMASSRARTLRLTFIASIAGLPAVAAPVPPDPEYPGGVCFIGPPGSDLGLIDLADQVMRSAP